MNNTLSNDRAFAVSLRRTFSAPRERVFAAWTDPEQLAQWFGPVGYRAEVLEMDVRVGGRYRIGFRPETATELDAHVYGTFLEVAPPERLRYTWVWEEQDAFPDTVVTVTFIDKGDETEVALSHERLPNAEECERHREGWTSTLTKLPPVLEKKS